MKKLLVGSLALASSMIISSSSFAVDEHGPRAGFVRSGADYVAELLVEKDQYRIYLLDQRWVDTDISGKTLQATVVRPSGKKSISCKAESRSFACGPAEQLADGDQLVFELKMPKGKAPNLFQYEFPLKHMQVGEETAAAPTTQPAPRSLFPNPK